MERKYICSGCSYFLYGICSKGDNTASARRSACASYESKKIIRDCIHCSYSRYVEGKGYKAKYFCGKKNTSFEADKSLAVCEFFTFNMFT